jgi:hypothetical protein
MEGDIKRIIDSIIELTYFMRGAISYEYALMNMSAGERDRAFDFINKRLETESKSMHPVY